MEYFISYWQHWGSWYIIIPVFQIWEREHWGNKTKFPLLVEQDSIPDWLPQEHDFWPLKPTFFNFEGNKDHQKATEEISKRVVEKKKKNQN